LKNVQGHKELALSQADTLRIQAMVVTLKETSRYHASSFADVDFKLITKMVLQWPVENIFPGMLPHMFSPYCGLFTVVYQLLIAFFGVRIWHSSWLETFILEWKFQKSLFNS